MPWNEEGNALVQDYEFPDFAAALAFVNEVGKLAEALGHHPDIHLHDWNHVRLELSTHSKGGVTELDQQLAAAIDDL
jgi:4a-hydroxytetrahydrobiopterin dehydratase